MVQEQTEKVGQISKPYKTFITQELVPTQNDSTRRFLNLPKVPNKRAVSNKTNILRVLTDIRNKIFVGLNIEQI